MRYVEFNGIVFSKDTNYPFYEFLPNDGSTVEKQTDIAVNVDGEIYSNFRYNARFVPIKGHIVGETEKELAENKQLLFIKCNGKTKGIIKYYDGFKLYQAEAIASIPTLSEQRGLCYEFNINFTLPKFYWEESDLTVFPLFQRRNVVLTEFTLPCVFTQRTAGNTIINENDFEVLPTIEFYASEETEYNLIIKNETTGESIELSNYTLNTGDTIIIDCEKMTAAHNGENIINSFNDFSDFSIIPGTNIITITNGGNETNCSVLLYYNKKMVGV